MPNDVQQPHPDYTRFKNNWLLCEDAYSGEKAVKDKGTTYLAPTAGMVAFGQGNDGQVGEEMYQAYKLRAVFPSVMEDAVEALLGIMHRKPPDIRVPTKMEPLLERATPDGESMELLLRRINEQQLVTGRLGLLLDLPRETVGTATPYIAMYYAKTVINWDDGRRLSPLPQKLNLVVLDETEEVRKDTFTWKLEEKYRVLYLGDLAENEAQGTYQQRLINLAHPDENEDIIPNIMGNSLDEVPFIFVNSGDLVVEPRKPPLLGLVNLAFAIYRGEADFRQALFMQGQDTLVVEGGEEDKTYLTGAGATITPPAGSKAYFIGVDSQGLTEMRKQLENDKKIAAHKAAQMTDTTSRQRESGEALRVRVAAQTATLNQIADAGAEGLQAILRICAKWMQLDPSEITVTPNKDFSADMPDGQTIKNFVEARVLGLPWSKRSMHAMLKRGGLTEYEFEEEMRLVAAEDEEDLARTGIGDADNQ